MSFIHLQVNSAYSLLTSTITIENLVQEAKRKEFSAIALTDRNVMYGTVAFYKECLKRSVKPIIGLTVDVLSEMDHTKSYPLVLLAKNNQGFQNLLKISSVVQTKSPNGIPIKWLRAYASGIFALTPGMEGEIEHYLLHNELEKAKSTLLLLSSLFEKDHFFLSIQDHGLAVEKNLLEQLIQLASETNTKLVITNNVFYLQAEDAFSHECLLAIKNGVKLQDEEREKLEGNQYYLKSSNEMHDLFAHIPLAIQNTLDIAEQCNVMIEFNKRHLPKFPTDGQSTEAMLEQLCQEGLNMRYQHSSPIHKDRLMYELNIIKKMKFSDYFLIVWDFMRYARENGILTGPGRGSAAGSIVAYCLNITDVDPIEHGLLFERFLNPERISMPDIDIDFPDHRRDEVIDYVVSKYGELHVAQIITFGTLAAKAAIRDVGRVFGLNTKELDQLSKCIPAKLGITLSQAIEESEALQQFVKGSELNRRLFETALKLEGLPRHTSTHAAGVVISEQSLIDLIPIQNGHNHVFLTQYSMGHLEALGLLKMDFLGLRNLSLIESILTSIYHKTGKKLDIKSIPLNDQATFELLSRGETTGIFQLESEGMRKVLMNLRPTHFEDIVAVNALYRPGPIEYIPLYIDRKHGRKPIDYPHPDLQPILNNTYGVIIYQEQIMQIASKMAGFSLGEADLLRRAVSKKQKKVLDKERAHFVKGALGKGYTEQIANSIYDLIVRFANYGFNRSHAVAYSYIAYQLAFLKTHYRLHFMASMLSSVIGNEHKLAQYIREVKQYNIKIMPPSINYSGYSFQVTNDGIRYSLAAIKGIGVVALKEIFKERKNGKFRDLFDFCLRVSSKAVNRKSLEVLVHSGSFDEFGVDRAVLLASLDIAIDHAELVKPDDPGQVGLFPEEEFAIRPKYAEVDPIRIEDKLAYERAVLGLYLSSHPISIYESNLQLANFSSIAELSSRSNRVRIGIYVTNIKKIRTKKGESMAFLTVSDQTDEIEAVVFPTVYRQINSLLVPGSLLILDGKLEIRNEQKQFIIQAGQEMSIWASQYKDEKLYLRIHPMFESKEQLTQLKEIFRQFHGETKVILYYVSNKKTVQLGSDFGIKATPACIQAIKHFLGEENVVFKT